MDLQTPELIHSANNSAIATKIQFHSSMGQSKLNRCTTPRPLCEAGYTTHLIRVKLVRNQRYQVALVGGYTVSNGQWQNVLQPPQDSGSTAEVASAQTPPYQRGDGVMMFSDSSGFINVDCSSTNHIVTQCVVTTLATSAQWHSTILAHN